jgi:hypothetical protein
MTAFTWSTPSSEGSTMAGYDCAGTVQQIWTSTLKNTFGNPAFWVRYFSPCVYTAVNSSSANANAECHVVWTSGAKHLGCVTTPHRVDGTYADGDAAAATFGSAIHQVWLWVSPLNLPNNHVLYCWLDQEPGYNGNLSVGFWNGWAHRLDYWNFNNSGIYPYWPALYCNPCDASLNCSSIRQADWPCYAVWSPHPQAACGKTCQNPPSWAASTCAGCGGGGSTPTKLWQFYTDPKCTKGLHVDLDLGAPNTAYAGNCLQLYYDPG